MSVTGNVNVSTITRLELFEEWFKLKKLKRKDCVSGLLETIFTGRNVSGHNIEGILENFIKNIEKRWKIGNNYKDRFLSKNKTWLESTIVFPFNEIDIHELEPARVGRPLKNFNECTIRSKQKKVQTLTSTATLEELSFATQSTLRKNGKRVAAQIIKEIMDPSSPKRAKKYKRSYNSTESGKQKPVPMTPEEALALIINTKSSKSTYLAYRSSAKKCNANVYPSWNNILSAKQLCYADENSLIIQDNSVEIKLQDLLNLTASRLCKLQEEVFKSLPSTQFNLICKWGIDGSSGQSNYRQLTHLEKGDSSVLIVSLVPIQLHDSEDETNVIWQNRVPSSTRFCRAIKFIFAKETPELTEEETNKIHNQIANLQTFVYQDKSITFKLLLTMVDGKVCQTLTKTKSTQSCYICLANPKQMNDLENIKLRLPRLETYSFGLSSLHSWIRFFECCLHVAYRLDIKRWQARGENKNKMEIRKKRIIDDLKKELGILVDQPKPGYGSTNTGNIARTFFKEYKKSAKITGVDEKIIYRMYMILQTISCGYEVDVEKFKVYAFETAIKFVSLYSWFYMPTSVHKVLIHGAEIIKHAILPIGQLGEEAQEAKNKDFKFIREHRSRKDSAEHTNIDLFNYFLLSSDPIISELGLQEKCSKKLRLDPEALQMLKAPKIRSSTNSDSE